MPEVKKNLTKPKECANIEKNVQSLNIAVYLKTKRRIVNYLWQKANKEEILEVAKFFNIKIN